MRMNSMVYIFLPLALIQISFLHVEVSPHFAFDNGRHVVVNPTALTWDDAVGECNEMNGTLLTVYDAGTLVDIGIGRKWIVWVGLKIEADETQSTVRWNSGESVTWSNWANPGNPTLGQKSCTLAITTKPYEWTPVNCSTKWPSLCEIHNGTCHFKEYQRSSLAGFNNDLLFNVDGDTCRDKCEHSDAFFCLSFEYNSLRRFCQLSNTHRWNEESQFAFSDREWNYYHRQCYTAYVDETWVPNGEIQTTTEGRPVTSAAETTSIVQEELTKPGFICVEIASLQPSENQTEEIRQDVKELKVLSEVYRERRRSQRKESATDNRPSARYLGTVALSITLCLLLAIVVLDLLTLTRHCPGNKSTHKDKVNFNRRSYKDFPTGRVIKLTSTWPTSVNASPGNDHYSCPADLDDVEIRLNDVDIRANQAKGEGFNLKVLEAFDEKSSNSYVSWPYGKSSPVLYPFHRSKSERADLQRRFSHSLRVTSTERSLRSKSDSFSNKRIFVLPETNSNVLAKAPGLTKTEQLVMAYGHHFDGDDSTTTFYRSLNVGKLRRGSHC